MTEKENSSEEEGGGEEEGDGAEERGDTESVGGETNLESELELEKEWGHAALNCLFPSPHIGSIFFRSSSRPTESTCL